MLLSPPQAALVTAGCFRHRRLLSSPQAAFVTKVIRHGLSFAMGFLLHSVDALPAVAESGARGVRERQ
jgi:hypothetical protein